MKLKNVRGQAEQIKNITIVGAGLIGGSIATSLKQNGFPGNITGFDRERNLPELENSGLFRKVTVDLKEALREADLVFICLPVKSILAFLPEILMYSKPGCILTDTGSTKRSIIERAQTLMNGSRIFIGGHPVAGKEISGFSEASNSLFRNKPYILIPPDKPDTCLQTLTALLESMGAGVIMMQAEEHDRIFSTVSHLPRLVSTLIINFIGGRSNRELSFAGSGLKSVAPLSGSAYTVWRDIFRDNMDFMREDFMDFLGYLISLSKDFTISRLEKEFVTGDYFYRKWNWYGFYYENEKACR